MAQHYSDETRESNPFALPDVEVFYVDSSIDHDVLNEDSVFIDDDGEYLGDGWYWWSCFPGCTPDSDPIGPFATEQEALDDARDY